MRILLSFGALAALVIAGCTQPGYDPLVAPLPLDTKDQTYHIADVHLRPVNESAAAVVFSVVNIRGGPVEEYVLDSAFRMRISLDAVPRPPYVPPDDYFAEHWQEMSVPFGDFAERGEHLTREFIVALPPSPSDWNYTAHVRLASASEWLTVESGCFRWTGTDFAPLSGDSCSSWYENSLRFDSKLPFVTHPEWERILLECCNWLPSPLDVYDLACDFAAGPEPALDCNVSTWNHKRNESHEPAGELQVWEIDPITGDRTDRGTISLDWGSTLLQPHEERTADVRVTLPVTANASGKFHVEARVWPEPHPERVVNTTATVKTGTV